MRALTVGSAMVDIIVIVDSNNVERMTMHNATSSFLLLEQGRKIEAQSVSEHIGGGAINAAVSLSRLGFDTAVLGKVGEDGNGEKIAARLMAENVDTGQLLRSTTYPSGTAVMISSHDRNATIFTQRGANTQVQRDEITDAPFANRTLIFVTNLSNASADCFPDIVAKGQQAGAFVAANPGIRQLTSRTNDFLRALTHVDLLAINRVEAEALIPRIASVAVSDEGKQTAKIEADNAARLMHRGLDFNGFNMSLAGYFQRLQKLGCDQALVTDGTHGAYLGTVDGIYHSDSVKVEPRGTAGAGDAFNSTFAAFYSAGETPETALRAAAINSASVVSNVDTQSGLSDRETLLPQIQAATDSLIVRHWPWAELGY